MRNQADSLVYQTEKLLRDRGDKLSVAERDQVEAALTKLKDTLAGSDLDAIRSATERLGTASQAMVQKLYEQAAETPSGSSDDEVVDAEIVDGGEAA